MSASLPERHNRPVALHGRGRLPWSSEGAALQNEKGAASQSEAGAVAQSEAGAAPQTEAGAVPQSESEAEEAPQSKAERFRRPLPRPAPGIAVNRYGERSGPH